MTQKASTYRLTGLIIKTSRSSGFWRAACIQLSQILTIMTQTLKILRMKLILATMMKSNRLNLSQAMIWIMKSNSKIFKINKQHIMKHRIKKKHTMTSANSKVSCKLEIISTSKSRRYSQLKENYSKVMVKNSLLHRLCHNSFPIMKEFPMITMAMNTKNRKRSPNLNRE